MARGRIAAKTAQTGAHKRPRAAAGFVARKDGRATVLKFIFPVRRYREKLSSARHELDAGDTDFH